MTIIYLKHPEHGTKIAMMEMEAEFDEQNGWVRYTDDYLSGSKSYSTNKRITRISFASWGS